MKISSSTQIAISMKTMRSKKSLEIQETSAMIKMEEWININGHSFR